MTITIRPLSVDATGQPLNNEGSETASISADGSKVTFVNFGDHHVYTYDLTTGADVDDSALGGTGFSENPDMAFDGSEISYKGMNDLIRQTVATGTTQPIDPSAEVSQISDDGSVVAFREPVGGTFVAAFATFDAAGVQTQQTFATNPGDPAGVDGISGDGRFVAFDVAATAGPEFGVASGGNTEVYLGDTFDSATPTLVSVNDQGQFAQNAGGDADSSGASVSQSGSRVVFASDATNLAFDAAGNPIPTNGMGEIYLRDVATGTTTLISKEPDGAAATGTGDDSPVISSDGKYVLFDSTDTLTPGASANGNVYVYNVETGTTTLVSRDAAGNASAGAFADNGGQSFSADDTETTFEEVVDGKGVVVAATAQGGAPTVALDPVDGTGTVDGAQVRSGATVTGTTTGAAGDTVQLFLDGRNATTGTAVATGTVAADGSFSIGLSPATLAGLSDGQHTLLATVQGDPTQGYLSGDATGTFTVDRSSGGGATGGGGGTTGGGGSGTGDAVSIDQNVAFVGYGTFVLTGQASSPAGVASVTFTADVDGTVENLGAATVNPDGSYRFVDRLGRHSEGFITATETDAAGGSVSTAAPFALTAGLNRGASARQDEYSADGSTDEWTGHEHVDGSRSVTVNAADETLMSQFKDTFRNRQESGTTFVFTPGYGQDSVHGFVAAGSGHDTLSLASSDFADLAQVLDQTQQTAAGAVIHDFAAGDTLFLAGVGKAQLAANPSDVAFHG